MSVISAKRKESPVQFVQTAGELLKYTIHKCLLLPKRLTFFITTKVADTIQDVYKKVLRIRTLYEEQYIDDRIKLCKECIADLEFIASELDIIILYAGENIPEYCVDIRKKNHINLKQFETWAKLIDDEIGLLKGLIKKDKERLK